MQVTRATRAPLTWAETTVAGAYTYETTMGGQLTVARLQVTKIDVIGHVD
jgi:hypothetical protein